MGRDPHTIERTIVVAGDPLAGVGAFLSDMQAYAGLGIDLVCVSPPGPDLAGWTSKVCEQVVPELTSV